MVNEILLISIFLVLVGGAGALWVFFIKPSMRQLNDSVKTEKAELEAERQKIQDLQAKYEELDKTKNEIDKNYALAAQEINQLTEQLSKGQKTLTNSENNYAEILKQNQDYSNQIVKLQAESKSDKELAKRTEAVNTQVKVQFEHLANKVLEDASSKFSNVSKEKLHQLLDPLNNQITDFKKHINDSFARQGQDHSALKREIELMVGAKDQLISSTDNLSKALKGDAKVQGDWGEFILADLLKQAGLVEGSNFTLQSHDVDFVDSEKSSRIRPDVLLYLPDKKSIVIDSKVSLTNYEAYVAAANNDEQKDIAAHQLKLFLTSVRRHVDDLSKKDYPSQAKSSTDLVIDFTIMFMPIEPAWMLLMQSDRQLLADAWKKNVAIVSPTTLFATLRAIAHSWRVENQNQNAREIAKRGGLLYDKFCGFLSTMESVGKNINNAQIQYDKAMGQLSQGPGNLVRQAEEMQKLGISNKKQIPKSIEGGNFLSPSTDDTDS